MSNRLSEIIAITKLLLPNCRRTFKEYASVLVKRISMPRGDSSRYLISQLRLSRHRYSPSNSVRPGSLRYGVQSTELKSWWNIIGECRYRYMYLPRTYTTGAPSLGAIQRNDYYEESGREVEGRSSHITNASTLYRPRPTIVLPTFSLFLSLSLCPLWPYCTRY